MLTTVEKIIQDWVNETDVIIDANIFLLEKKVIIKVSENDIFKFKGTYNEFLEKYQQQISGLGFALDVYIQKSFFPAGKTAASILFDWLNDCNKNEKTDC